MDKEGDLSACRDGFLMLTGRVRGKRASLACGVDLGPLAVLPLSSALISFNL